MIFLDLVLFPTSCLVFLNAKFFPFLAEAFETFAIRKATENLLTSQSSISSQIIRRQSSCVSRRYGKGLASWKFGISSVSYYLLSYNTFQRGRGTAIVCMFWSNMSSLLHSLCQHAWCKESFILRNVTDCLIAIGNRELDNGIHDKRLSTVEYK